MSAPKNILVPTDFSKHSEHALLYAASLGERFGSTITLLHAFTFVGFEDEPDASDFPDMGPLLEQADRAARAHLDAGVDHGGEAVPSVKKAVVHAVSAHDAILGYARQEKADLIVIARRGLGDLAHVMLGSVTERVIRFSPCPVLVVVRGGREFVEPSSGAVHLGKVVIADNLDKGPQRAMKLMVDQLRPYKPEVHMVHAVENSVPRAYSEMGLQQAFSINPELREKISERLIERAREVVPEDWTVFAEVREGKPRRVVTRYAKDIESDLLIVAAERRTDLGERIMGGTTARIIRRSPCPALVV